MSQLKNLHDLTAVSYKIHDKNRKEIVSIKQQRDGDVGTAAYTLSLL